MERKTLVLGLGNTLLGDEGAGVHAVRALQEQYADRADVEFLDGGTLSFTLAGPIEDADSLIVIDATQLQAAPGTVRVFESEDMDRFLGSHRKNSVHEVSLMDLMAISRLVEALPARRALIGIQPEYLDWADAPTDAVARAIPVACDLAMELIGKWRHEQGAGDRTPLSRSPSGDASVVRGIGAPNAVVGVRSAGRSRCAGPSADAPRRPPHSDDATGRELPPATDSGSSPIAEDSRRWRHEQGAGAPRSGDATGRELPPATDSGSSPIAEDSRRWRDELEFGDRA